MKPKIVEQCDKRPKRIINKPKNYDEYFFDSFLPKNHFKRRSGVAKCLNSRYNGDNSSEQQEKREKRTNLNEKRKFSSFYNDTEESRSNKKRKKDKSSMEVEDNNSIFKIVYKDPYAIDLDEVSCTLEDVNWNAISGTFLVLYLGVNRPLYPTVYENMILVKNLFLTQKYVCDNDSTISSVVSDSDTLITEMWAMFATSTVVINNNKRIERLKVPIIHPRLRRGRSSRDCAARLYISETDAINNKTDTLQKRRLIDVDGDNRLYGHCSYSLKLLMVDGAHCSRTYGSVFDYTGRNSTDLYKFILNRKLTRSYSDNAQYSGKMVSQARVKKKRQNSIIDHSKTATVDEEKSINQLDTVMANRSNSVDNIDDDDDDSNSPNLFVSCLHSNQLENIFSANDSTDVRYRIIEQKQPIRYYDDDDDAVIGQQRRWVLLPMNNVFNFLITDRKELIYRSDLLETLHRAEFYRRPFLLKTRENEDFGVYSFPGLPSFVLVGPFYELERHRMMASLLEHHDRAAKYRYSNDKFRISFKILNSPDDKEASFNGQFECYQDTVSYMWWKPFCRPSSDACANELYLNTFFSLVSNDNNKSLAAANNFSDVSGIADGDSIAASNISDGNSSAVSSFSDGNSSVVLSSDNQCEDLSADVSSIIADQFNNPLNTRELLDYQDGVSAEDVMIELTYEPSNLLIENGESLGLENSAENVLRRCSEFDDKNVKEECSVGMKTIHSEPLQELNSIRKPTSKARNRFVRKCRSNAVKISSEKKKNIFIRRRKRRMKVVNCPPSTTPKKNSILPTGDSNEEWKYVNIDNTVNDYNERRWMQEKLVRLEMRKTRAVLANFFKDSKPTSFVQLLTFSQLLVEQLQLSENSLVLKKTKLLMNNERLRFTLRDILADCNELSDVIPNSKQILHETELQLNRIEELRPLSTLVCGQRSFAAHCPKAQADCIDKDDTNVSNNATKENIIKQQQSTRKPAMWTSFKADIKDMYGIYKKSLFVPKRIGYAEKIRRLNELVSLPYIGCGNTTTTAIAGTTSTTVTAHQLLLNHNANSEAASGTLTLISHDHSYCKSFVDEPHSGAATDLAKPDEDHKCVDKERNEKEEIWIGANYSSEYSEDGSDSEEEVPIVLRRSKAHSKH